MTCQIRHLNQAFEPRVILYVQAVELDSIGPRVAVRWLQQMPDLVVVDIERQNLVRRLRHNLLTEMGANETAGTDHANRHGLDRLPVQIHPRRRRHYLTRSLYDTVLVKVVVMQMAICVNNGVEIFGVRRGIRSRRIWTEKREVRNYLKGVWNVGLGEGGRDRDRGLYSISRRLLAFGLGHVGGCWLPILRLRTEDWHFWIYLVGLDLRLIFNLFIIMGVGSIRN